MAFLLSDLDRVISLTHPVLHPHRPIAVLAHKRVSPDHQSYESRLIAVGPAQTTRFLTLGPHDAHPVFSRDGRHLWFVRRVKPRGQSLMRLPWDGGEAESIGPVFWDVSKIQSIPSSADVLVLARRPEPPPEDTPWPRHYDRWQWQADGQSYFSGHPIRLWRVDPTGNVTCLDESPYDVGSLSVSPDGHFAVYDRIRNEEDARLARSDIFQINLFSSGEPAPLTHGPQSWHSATVREDGRMVALGAGREFGPATIERLYAIGPDAEPLPLPSDLEVGEGISSDIRFGPEPMRPLAFGNQGVVLAATQRGKTGLWVADNEGASPLSCPVPVVAQYASRGRTLVIVGASLTSLDEAYWYDEGQWTPLTTFNHWAPEKITVTVLRQVEQPDGLTIPAYVTGLEPGHRKPLILYIHGGPHGAYGENVRYDTQVMAEQEYIVVQVNPRGSMGYGQAFRNAVRGDWGGRDMEDLMAHVDHLVAEGVADPTRLYVTGGSYGGFMTSWIVGHSARFRAASTVVPVTNLVSFFGTSDIGWWFGPGEVGITPFDDIESLWKASPIAYADHVTTPTQIVAGEDDRRCPIEQAEQFYTALKHFGVETEFLRYPGPHSFSTQGRPDLRQDRLSRVLQWFDRFSS